MDNNKIRHYLSVLKLSCKEALNETWDKSDAGFEDMIEIIEEIESEMPLTPIIGKPQNMLYRATMKWEDGQTQFGRWYNSHDFVLAEVERLKTMFTSPSPIFSIEATYFTEVPL